MGNYINTERADAMSINEIKAMFQKSNDDMINGIMSVLLMTGSRISEVLMLLGKDITADDENIFINSYVLKKKDGRIHRLNKKIKRTHMFFPWLERWINNNHFSEDNLIFDTNRQNVWRKIKYLNPNTTTHLFRHTVATFLGQNGMDVFTLQRWMGWSRLDMATRYVHPKNVIDTGANILDEVF